tara:strand:+ start:335 stop:1282 length:948 start_codon:yes stop_codon:yes gene_type:complete
MKIVYVTGCLGFIGSYVTRRCLQKGWRVYGIDKCTYVSNTKLISEFNEYDNFHFENIDIKDLNHLYDCDYIINTAAESHVGNSIIDSEEFINSNIIGVRNLLDLIKNKSENCNRRPIFFHFSTDEVYGDITEGEHTEKDLLHPSNPYSAAKAAADMFILAWARTYNIEYIIIRPTNNYGIGQYPEKLIPLSVKNLSRGRKIRLHDGGEPIRNWLHADDTAAAVMTIIEAEAVNEIYNISGELEQKNVDTIKKVIYHFDKSYSWQEWVDFSYSRQGQDVRYCLSDKKLRALGWKPQKKFDKEINSIVQYYKENFIW